MAEFSANTQVLVERAQSGDETAREELFAQVEGSVLRLVRRRMGKRLRARFESVDIVQSVLADALVGLDGFKHQGDRALMRYLTRTVENKLRNKARALNYGDRDPAKGVPLKPADSVDPGVDPAAPGPGVVTLFEQGEDRETLARAMERLSERERVLIRLRDLERLSWEEVLQRTGEETKKAAQGAHTRAMLRLSRYLREERGSS